MKEADGQNSTVQLFKKQILQGYLNSQSPISADGVNRDCLLVFQSEEHKYLGNQVPARQRFDGKQSKIENLFSQKRDRGKQNELKIYSSEKFIVTNDTSKPPQNPDAPNELDFMNYIKVPDQAMKDAATTSTFFGALDLNILNQEGLNKFKFCKSTHPVGSKFNLDKQIIPSVLPLLTTMQFPFYSATGLYMAKNSFKIGVKTNLPVWLFCDINFSTLNGSLSFNQKGLKMFFSWKGLKAFIQSKASHYRSWRNFWIFMAVVLGSWTTWSWIKKIKEARRREQYRNMITEDILALLPLQQTGNEN